MKFKVGDLVLYRPANGPDGVVGVVVCPPSRACINSVAVQFDESDQNTIRTLAKHYGTGTGAYGNYCFALFAESLQLLAKQAPQRPGEFKALEVDL